MTNKYHEWIAFYNQKELLTVSSQIDWLEKSGEIIYPATEDMLKAFELCPLTDIKAVIVGQDPSPIEGVANGLAFGAKKEAAAISPSLKFLASSVLRRYGKEEKDMDYTLESWAKQGILLLNGALTVSKNSPGSHLELWRKATTSFLMNLSYTEQGICYVLLGDYAKSFKKVINPKNNVIFLDNLPSHYLSKNPSYIYSFFEGIEVYLKFKYNEKIKWINYE